MNGKPLIEYWTQHPGHVKPVVPAGRFGKLDLSELPKATYADLEKFSGYIDEIRNQLGVTYLAGGYGELRNMYSVSTLFDSGEEPRRLHLGLDIWGPAGTLAFAAASGTLHSAAYNEGRGNYGGTVILRHDAPFPWYTLYGHLARESNLPVNYEAGDPVGIFGTPEENGNWPPHLHFQVILDMQGMYGDYPGVCRASESAAYLANCPDAGRLLEISLGLY